ncbi:MAG: hypothetical protein ACW98I_20260 [Candidatus Hodarchaeales archaeon]|jgi:hypothetical protein
MKSKNIIFLGILFTVLFSSSAMGIPQATNQEESYFSVDWETTFGGNANEVVRTVIKTDDNGYIAAGRTESSGAGDSDAFIVKLDASGNLLWNKTFGGVDFEAIREISDTTDGNFILTGETGSFGAGEKDLWLLKIDTDGNLLWNKTFGLADADWGTALVRSGDNIFVTGFYHPILGATGELLLLKIDQDGNFLWNKTYGFGRGFDIITVDNNGILIAGLTGHDYTILRVDDQGNELWRKTYGGPLNDVSDIVISTPDGGFLIGGHSQSFGAGGEDAWVIKVDKDGNHEWNKTFGGILHDWPNALLNYKDGGYLVCIHTKNYRNGDNWLIKLNGLGDIEWKHYSGYPAYDDFAFDMIEVAGNKYVLAGRTQVDETNSDIWMFQITINDENSSTSDSDFSTTSDSDSSSTNDPKSSTPVSSGFFLLSVLAIPGVISHRRRKIS